MTTTCTRYRADGGACDNATDHDDGWCRADGCDGHLRRDPAHSPAADRAPGPSSRSAERRAAWVERPHPDVDVDDVRMTLRAVDSFRYHHGGSADTAEAELRVTLEDFLLRSRCQETARGYVNLLREGYRLTLSPDLTALVLYSTVHRERTWSQVRAGVPSRIAASRRRPAPEPPPLDGEPVVLDPPSSVLPLIDVPGLHLTASTLARVVTVSAASGREGEPEEVIRGALQADLDRGSCDVTWTGEVHLVTGCTALWVLTADLRRLIGARPLAPDVQGSPA